MSFPLPLLLPPATLLYPFAFDSYREVEVRDAAGEPLLSTYEQPVTNEPAMFEEGQSQQGTQGGFIRGETDNMFTYDTVRLVFGPDVRGQDVLVQTVGPDAGRYYRVEGNPRKFPHLGNYQEVLCAKLEARPDWVPAP